MNDPGWPRDEISGRINKRMSRMPVAAVALFLVFSVALHGAPPDLSDTATDE